jgi:hypothetical protein
MEELSKIMRSLSVSIEFITHQQAKAMLACIDTRRSKPTVVERYGRDMDSGEFVLADSILAITPEGTVTNAGHRIRACAAKPGRGFWAVVVRGVPREWASRWDQGVKRSLSDSLKIIFDMSIPGGLAATMNSMRLPAGRGRSTKMTASEAAEFFSRHEAAISFVHSLLTEKQKGIGRSTVRAVLARATYHESKDKLARFCEILKGAMPSEEESAAFCVIKMLLGSTRDGDTGEIHRKVESGLWSFCHGEQLKKLYQASDELYPLPEEKGPTRNSSAD